MHYCDLKVKDSLNKNTKISFKVRENTIGGKNLLVDKLNLIREKIEVLGLELNEVSKTQTNMVKTSDISPISVRWDTKPINYNKKSLVTNFDKIKKGQFNKVSEDNVLFSKKTSNKKLDKKIKKSEVSTSACSERK